MVEKLLVTTNSVLKRNANRSIQMTTFEKITAVIIFAAVVILMFATIYTKTMVDSVNQSIETVHMETKLLVTENQLLQQKIDHLMTNERIERVAEKYGMTRDVTNVKSVKK